MGVEATAGRFFLEKMQGDEARRRRWSVVVLDMSIGQLGGVKK